MKDVDLRAIAEGVRGSEGKVTIPLHQAKELKLKTIEVLKNGSARVSCVELCNAIPDATTSPKKEQPTNNKPNGKKTDK